MDRRTLTALKTSIAKWESNARAEAPVEYLTAWTDCPLCLLFYENKCIGCPVFEETKLPGCDRTPYFLAAYSHEAWNNAVEDGKDDGETDSEYGERIGALRRRAQSRAAAEVNFLKSLLPDGASGNTGEK